MFGVVLQVNNLPSTPDDICNIRALPTRLGSAVFAKLTILATSEMVCRGLEQWPQSGRDGRLGDACANSA